MYSREGKKCPLLFRNLLRLPLSPTSPNLQYTLQKGRCLLTSHFVLVIWRARYTAGGFPNRWIRGGGWKNTGVADAMQAFWRFWSSTVVVVGGQSHPSGTLFTSFIAESRWLLPGSDLGPGVPCCKRKLMPAWFSGAIFTRSLGEALAASPGSR